MSILRSYRSKERRIASGNWPGPISVLLPSLNKAGCVAVTKRTSVPNFRLSDSIAVRRTGHSSARKAWTSSKIRIEPASWLSLRIGTCPVK